ncbi:hypothetical protein GCM10023084_07220 [Streptomyces lacrimifluminis]|uniref:Uncharacterized protein n=1 Tax=Streptomyces lacrimifluminis TaxID=1500077 RepID=A0A917KR81_9ACTN|nr:hypothetical protein GCM10012282_22650 [Streptomyces lacrimifluminis]
MPEPTPNLYAANTTFHKEVRQPASGEGRATSNAPPKVHGASGQRPATPLRATCENGQNPTARRAAAVGGAAVKGGAFGRPTAPGRALLHQVRGGGGYFTGRWYATW